MKVQELIEILEGIDGDAEVLVAMQPSYPLQAEFYTVVEVIDSRLNLIVYIGVTEARDYLIEGAKHQLGW